MQRVEGPRGFNDILPAESWRWQAVERMAHETAELYHFAEIRTPILEHTELFHRGVGETSDVVHKETYTFTDRGDRSMTLRPEGTAGVVRAAIQHSLIAQEGARAKLYYIGPNFRYERPAAGRVRQHHQFGAELFGVADPAADVECILLQMDFYARCGLKGLKLQVNSLGDSDSKARYRDIIVEKLTPVADRLSEDSQRRLTENPLRILDSKVKQDIEACADLPPATDALSERSRAHFERVLQLLEGAVEFEVNPRLVRGFDYYTETLWEVTADGLGAQNAVGGGGRYDNLVEQLGGRATPGVGFGSGLERLLLALEAQGVALPNAAKPLIWLCAHGEAAQTHNMKLMRELRTAGIACDMDLSGRSMKAQMKAASNADARWCIVVGDAELDAGTVVLKDMEKRAEQTIMRDAVVAVFSA